MSRAEPGDVTLLLKAWGNGDEQSLERLIPVLYDQLRRMAGDYMRHERPGNTLQPTALVNEVYLKLVGVAQTTWQDRAHFFAVSARMMRRILVDRARARRAAKRGGADIRVELNESLDGVPARSNDLIAVDEAVEMLAKFDARKAHVVELKFFGGLTVEEIAVVLKISPRSVMRDWNLARAWLTREMNR
jgi:RNA polymerase sigma factor (TIGR02999 family)